MSERPQPESEREPSSRLRPRTGPRPSRWLSFLLVLGLGSGSALATTWLLLHRFLPPTVAAILSETLERPVELGELAGFGLNHVRFGETSLPATAHDPDFATVQGITARFSLWRLVRDRQLVLDLTLQRPEVYLEQAPDGRLLDLPPLPERDGEGRVKVAAVSLEAAQTTLRVRQLDGSLGKPIQVDQAQGRFQLGPRYESTTFDLNGRLAEGQFSLQGAVQFPDFDLEQLTGQLSVRGQRVQLSGLSSLLPPLPLHLQSGQVGGQVQVELDGNFLNWRQNTPRLTGLVQIRDVQAVVNRLPETVRVSQGRVRLQGDRARVENVRAEVGDLQAQLSGLVSIDGGYDLEVAVAPVTLAALFDMVVWEPPDLALAGAIAVQAAITGDLEDPILSGRLTNACRPAVNRLSGPQPRTCPLRVDRLDFETVATDFTLHWGAQTLTLDRFFAQPRLGGTITAQGDLRWSEAPLAALEVQLFGLPGAALAQLYDLALPLELGEIGARAQLAIALNNPRQVRATVASQMEVGGGQVRVDPFTVVGRRFTGRLQASGLTAARLGLATPLPGNSLAGDLTVAGSLTPPLTEGLALAGQVQVAIAGGSLVIDQLQLANQQLTATVNVAGINARALLPQELPLPPLGRLGGQVQVSSQLEGFRPRAAQAVGNLGLEVAGGRAQVTQLSWESRGPILAAAQWDNLQVAQLVQPFSLPSAWGLQRGALGRTRGEARLTLPWAERSRWEAIALQGRSQITNLAGGSLATNFSVRAGQWQAEVRLAGLQARRLSTRLPAAWQTVAGGTGRLAGPLRDFSLARLQGTGSADLQLAGGRVAVSEWRLAQGQLQARLQPQGLRLATFSPALRGQLQGTLTARTDLRRPRALQAAGQVRFSEGVAAIRQPLTAAFTWQGSRLAIAQAQAGDQFQARGWVDFNLAALGRSPVTAWVQSFNLETQVRNLALASLRADLARFTTLPLVADSLAVGGTADFSGTLTGNLRSPRLQGNLALNNLTLNDLVLDPRLAGPVAFLPGQGAQVALQGSGTDRVQASLDGRYRPLSLDLRLGEAGVMGRRTGPQTFTATVQGLRLDLVRPLLPEGLLTPTLLAQPLAGELQGRFDLDLTTDHLTGTVVIARPHIGPLRGERFTGELDYRAGAIALRDGRWHDGATEYRITSRLAPFGPQPQVEAQIEIVAGQVQDLLAALNLADFPDLRHLIQDFQVTAPGRAADLATLAIGLPGAPVEDQVRRLAEIQALRQQQEDARRAAIPLPDLSEARGRFNGLITLGGPLNQGLNALQARFNLAGSDWEWGSYFADAMIARGDFQNGVLTILPLRFRTGEGEIALAGSFGAEAISGQLEITELPIDTLQDIIPLPPWVGFRGRINASVALAGTEVNPQAQGTIQIADAELNETPVYTAAGSFNYNNAVLRFAGNSTLAEGGTPLTLSGRIPYRLPLPQAQPPDSYDFNLVARAQDDGLAILNFFTNRYLTWQVGQGEADIEISGQINPQQQRVESLITQGLITIEQAELGSRVVPEPITDVQGQIVLNTDRIEVPGLTGRFGGGDLRLAGGLPTYQTLEGFEQPLTLELGRLKLRLKGLMEGDVRGTVTVAGTVLDPKLTGTIDLEEGNLQLAGAVGRQQGLRQRPRGNFFQRWVEFDDLRLVLGRNFFITQPGILSFEADGTLTLAGTLEQLEPRGTIRLERGAINLFTTQLRLDRSEENIARFTPVHGFDPFLNLVLTGTVTDVTTRTIQISPGAQSSEIVDTPRTLGSVETIRVRARVEALASELTATLNAKAAGIPSWRQQVLQLSSSPSRSETEIIALMGGSFVNAIAGGDDVALVGGIANLAGGALLGRFQSEVADALGLSEFRIFPAEVFDRDERRSRSSQLGVAVEVSKDISTNFSLSVLQYITPANQPTRFSGRYRINESLILRGSTDFGGDSRATVEFQTRF